MKYAIFSDIHSNIHAFDAAYKLVRDKVDKKLCLGDVTGYNAFPSKCVNKAKRVFDACVVGNHDDLIAYNGNSPTQFFSDFSTDAQNGAMHSIKDLSDKSKKWLEDLPMSKVIKDEYFDFIISHAAAHDEMFVSHFPYLFSRGDARLAFTSMMRKTDSRLMFVGHTHLPTFVSSKKKDGAPEIEEVYLSGIEDGKLSDCQKPIGMTFDLDLDNNWYIVNPGSIGQPRAGIPVSYLILDTEKKTVSFEKFEYDVKAAADAIREKGYSTSLANRLEE